MKVYFCNSEVLSKGVVEFLDGDLAVSVLVESSEQGVLLVLRDEDVHGSEASNELGQVHEAVVVLVQGLHQVDGEVLEVTEFSSSLFDFLDDGVHRGSWEGLGIVFHVLLGVLVSLDQLEFETDEEEGLSNEEVLLGVVSAGDGVGLLLSLNEGSSNSS